MSDLFASYPLASISVHTLAYLYHLPYYKFNITYPSLDTL